MMIDITPTNKRLLEVLPILKNFKRVVTPKKLDNHCPKTFVVCNVNPFTLCSQNDTYEASSLREMRK